MVCHNAAFDVGVTRYACAADGIAWPQMRFVCTMVLVRRALSLPSYRLAFVVEALGKKFDLHHDPLADARAVVDIVDGLATANDAVEWARLEPVPHEEAKAIAEENGFDYLGPLTAPSLPDAHTTPVAGAAARSAPNGCAISASVAPARDPESRCLSIYFGFRCGLPPHWSLTQSGRSPTRPRHTLERPDRTLTHRFR